MLRQYFHILLFALIGLVFGVMLIVVSSLVRLRGGRKDLTSYECGMEAVGSPWISPNIRFYVFALFFVIFDAEVLFIYPWAVQFKTLGVVGYVEVVIFVAILFLGLIYAWKKDALKWE
ncbi:MAG TPA: NADH-quinone oxidoreductase subunit A [Elusimicrobiota bacterium]|nr:NADH-quinone oxidoreductase subunit A [Elusimicrobiota bacterium]